MLAWMIAILIVLSIVIGAVLFVSFIVHLRREKIRRGKNLKDVCNGIFDSPG